MVPSKSTIFGRGAEKAKPSPWLDYGVRGMVVALLAALILAVLAISAGLGGTWRVILPLLFILLAAMATQLLFWLMRDFGDLFQGGGPYLSIQTFTLGWRSLIFVLGFIFTCLIRPINFPSVSIPTPYLFTATASTAATTTTAAAAAAFAPPLLFLLSSLLLLLLMWGIGRGSVRPCDGQGPSSICGRNRPRLAWRSPLLALSLTLSFAMLRSAKTTTVPAPVAVWNVAAAATIAIISVLLALSSSRPEAAGPAEPVEEAAALNLHADMV